MAREESSFSLGQFKYVDAITHASPVGEFRECRHVQTGERRGLKIVGGEFGDKRVFLGWYDAALSLAGEAAESLRLPGLIGPIRAPDGKWFSLRDGIYVVERRFFGDERNPAWNLNEFIARFHHGGQGVDENIALALMRQVVSVLRIMHGSRLSGTMGVELAFVPHLNLKPQNVIIGRDPQTYECQVCLTDFLTAMAAPLAEESGIRAPLNYSAPEILRDNTYIAQSADIFSCGLLLYRLVHNDDLIPGNLSRVKVLEFIKNKLPERLKGLKPAGARGQSSNIIRRCLNAAGGDRYDTIAELGNEIDNVLEGSDPDFDLRSLIETPAAEPPPQVPRPRARQARQRPPRKRSGRKWVYLFAAAAVIVIAYFAYRWYDQREWEKTATARRNDVRQLWHSIDAADFPARPVRRDVESRIKSANDLFAKAEYEAAVEQYAQIHRRLSEIQRYCATLELLRTEADRAEEPREDILAEFNIALDSAWRNVGRELFTDAERYRQIAQACVDSMSWRCNPAIIDTMRRELARIDNNLPCRGDAAEILRSAVEACAANDLDAFARYRTGFATRISRDDCRAAFDCEDYLRRLRGIPGRLTEDCHEEGRDLLEQAERACAADDSSAFMTVRHDLIILSRRDDCRPAPVPTCEVERRLLDSAKALFAEYQRVYETVGVPYDDEDSEFQRVGNGLQRGDFNLGNGNCSAVEFAATEVLSLLEGVRPCMELTEDVLRAREIIANDPERYREQRQALSVVDTYLREWKCTSAHRQLSLILPGIGKPPAPDSGQEVDPAERIITSDDCWDAYRSGDADAWRICEKVAPDDSTYKLSMKVFIMAAGRAKKFEPEFRARLQAAFDASGVDRVISKYNTDIYITMTCAYGADTAAMNVVRALYYFEKAKAQGIAPLDNSNWWMARLIEIRCHVRRWRESNTPQRKRLANNRAQKFTSDVEQGELPDVDPMYVEEVDNYIKSMRSK